MKTIEERASEFAERHEHAELILHGLSGVYGYSRIYNAEICAYERGATEQKAIDEDAIHAIVEEQVLKAIEKQKAIDIDKACEWLKENISKYTSVVDVAHPQEGGVKYHSITLVKNLLFEDLRKAMKE